MTHQIKLIHEGIDVLRTLLFASLLSLCSCAPSESVAQSEPLTLKQARRSHETELKSEERDERQMPEPPEIFSLVKFPTAIGDMSAYLSRPEEPDEKYPAIVWITGGFPAGGIGASAWESRESSNDQSAKVYRQTGVVMMYPALRGSLGNPGVQESFYGEVDDVNAAIDFLSKVDYVDPQRIYLGGHSTGGTLALLVAASNDNLKGFLHLEAWPIPSSYGADRVTYDVTNETENRLRSPIHYINTIKVPTFVLEGVRRKS